MKRGLPQAYPGMRIGLLGGSFDPAHAGHAHVAETALKQLGLDKVWWLVAPQNPLKPRSSPPAARLASAQRLTRGARMRATDIETRLGCAFTYETLRALKARYPGVAFTFIMGTDNLSSFRRWRNWCEVAHAVPVAVVARPGVTPRDIARMPRGWRYLRARHDPSSSTALRTLSDGRSR